MNLLNILWKHGNFKIDHQIKKLQNLREQKIKEKMQTIKVKDLISELQKCNPEAVVLYAYEQYGRTGVHDFISKDNSVVLDSNDRFAMNDNELIWYINEDADDLSDEIQEVIDKHNNVQPAIILFAR